MKVWLLALVACGSSNDSAPAPSAPSRTPRAPPDAALVSPPPDAEPAPHLDADRADALRSLRASLGATVIECEGTARILSWLELDLDEAETDATRAAREQALVSLCQQERWPRELRTCVASEPDPLQCTVALHGKQLDRLASAILPASSTPGVTPTCDAIAAHRARPPGFLGDCCDAAERRRIYGQHCTRNRWSFSVFVQCRETNDVFACPYAVPDGLSTVQQRALSKLESTGGGLCRCAR